jgi:hypothetical protein
MMDWPAVFSSALIIVVLLLVLAASIAEIWGRH